MVKLPRVVLGVCGSIAAYKAADLIRRLQDKGAEVSVIMTAEAKKFITPVTLATLCGENVYEDMFDARGWSMAHISLAKEAQAVVIAPATANVIAKLAHGMADDLLTTFALSVRAPIFIAPAMHDEMYTNVIVAENCTKLRKFGITIIEPGKGKLANGEIGIGRLADVDEIVRKVLGK